MLETTFRQHGVLLMRTAFRQFGWARDMAIGGAISVAGLTLQVWWKLIPATDWSQHKWQWIGTVTIPVAVVLGGHIAWRAITAPWRVYQSQEREHELEAQKATDEAAVLAGEISRLKDRLAPKLHILPSVSTQPWQDQRGNCVSYYIDVENQSEGTTINGVKVKLTKLDPDPLKWLPLPLHIKHDNQAPYKTECDLNPLEKIQIDLISSVQKSGVIDIVHIIGNVQVNLPANKYRLTVTASGKDTLPATATFDAWVDHTGYLRCEAIRTAQAR